MAAQVDPADVSFQQLVDLFRASAYIRYYVLLR